MRHTRCSTALAVGAGLLAGLIAAAPARADAISTQQLSLLQQFNLIDLGDLTDSADVEGRAFVAGNVSGSFTTGLTSADITPSPEGYNTLIVDGNVSGHVNINHGGFTVGGNAGNSNANNSAGTVSTVAGNVSNIGLNGGTLQYGGTASGNFNLNGGATKSRVTGLPTDPLPATTFDTLKTLSTSLDNLAANSTASMVGNVATFDAVAGAGGLAVFDIGASLAAQIFNAATFKFNLGSATGVIINVDDPGTINDKTNFNGTSIAQYLLWNFVGTTNIHFGTEFAGTVLAPSAFVTNSGPIDGTLVAASANLSGELHSHPYTGSVGPSPVPEPSGVAVVAAGLIGLAVLRRRRTGAAEAAAPLG